jgi:GNAT superfamily N-acetyltransferase
MSTISKNMHVVLADKRLLWRVINYLQRDATLKGVLKGKGRLADSNFFSFWHNMDDFMPAARQNRLYVVLDSRHHLIAYFIVNEPLHDGQEGTLPVDFFEVLPKYRKRGVGSFMVSWLEDKASVAGFHSLRVLPANGSNCFWSKKGFSSWGDSHGYLMLPIA